MKISEIFDNKYEIVKVLGMGGMGTVYLARNIKLNTFWAIKEVRKEGEEKFDLLAEPNMLKKLSHAALPRIFDIVEDEKNIYIIEDYIEGQSLDKQLKSQEKFKEARVINWMKQICEALKYLHENEPNPIIYRDMKPGNLMVDQKDNLKIIDFGIAREFKEESESDTTYMGTRGYAAPEQYGTAQTDGRTDIYSLGVTAYHLVTGKSPNDPPFEILPVRKLDKKLSVGMEYIIEKCTQKDPQKRYQNINQLIKDLNNIHKFGSAYKRKKAASFIKSVMFLSMLTGFSYLTYAGVMELDVEKNQRYEENINESREAVEQKAYPKAEEMLEAAIDEIPERLEAYKDKVKLFYSMGDYERCKTYAEDIFMEYPELIDDENINYILGTIYFEEEDYVEASKYLVKARNKSMYKVEYSRDLAVCYAKLKNIEGAREILKFIDDNKLSEEVSYYVGGEIFIASGMYEEAVVSLKNSLGVSEDMVVRRKAYIALGEVLLGYHGSTINRPDEGVQIIEAALREVEDKNDTFLIEMLAKAYYNFAVAVEENREENFIKSAENFQRLITLGYKRAYIYRNIYAVFAQLNNLEKCEEILMQMQKLYPEDYTCYKLLAILTADMENKKPNENRDYGRMLEFYELAVKYAPEGDKTQDLMQLNNLIKDLRKGNWIK